MRRFFLFLSALILVLALSPRANAVSAPKISVFATVTADGRCRVNMTVTVHLDQVAEDLQLPVPADAAGISVNGSRTVTSRSGDVRLIHLNRVIGKSVGDITFTVSYSLPDVIHTNELGLLELQLPLLSGFDYPVEHLEFSAALPGAVDALPGFTSGYHQSSIEQHLTYRVDGATIYGNSLDALKDHETLMMKLTVSDVMFPQSLADTRDWSAGGIAMAVCAGAAVLYWLLFLRFIPWRRERRSEPPEGYTAGDMGTLLSLQGTNVTLTVLTWARLGYVLLRTDRKGHVMIEKRMDMGNERKESEQRLFRTLFSRADVVDTTKNRYAELCLSAEKKPVGIGDLVHRRSGNPKVFRFLAAGIGLFGGACIAIAMGSGALLQGLLILVLGICGGLSGWYLLGWGWHVRSGRYHRLLGHGSVCGLWLLLGLAAGIFTLALWMVLGLLVAGILLAWSGRRTAQGSALSAQARGLRRYLRTVDTAQLRRICETDPDYFFTMAPYALAFGLGMPFARRFGKLRLEECPYLQTEAGGATVTVWMRRLQQTVRAMDERAEKRSLEQLLVFIQNLIKR